MSAPWMVFLVLTSPPVQQPAVAPVPETAVAADTVRSDRLQPVPGLAEASHYEPDELREAYTALLQKSARRADPDPKVLVPQLAALYMALDEVDGMSHAETSRMRGCLKIRLEQMQDRLLRDLRRQRQKARRERRRAALNGESSDAPTQLAGGRAEAARVAQLIDLIQSTIAPESWEVNGGRGTVKYFGPAKALVIRQRGEVHHQLGDALEQLRKAN